MKRYYYQLVTGCGNSKCSFKICASNPKARKFSNEMAAVMAFQLASSTKLNFCERIPENPLVLNAPFPIGLVTRRHDIIQRSRSVSVGGLTNYAAKKPLLQSMLDYIPFSGSFTFTKESQLTKSHLQSKSLDMDIISNFKSDNFDKNFGRIPFERSDSPPISEVSSSGNSAISSLPSYGGEDLFAENIFGLARMTYSLMAIAVETVGSKEGEDPDTTFLCSSIRSVYSSLEALSQSFLIEEGKIDGPNLNVEEVVQSYDLLLSQYPKQLISETLLGAVGDCLNLILSEVQKQPRLNTSTLRALVILMLNPLFAKPEPAFKQLCCIIERLKSKPRNNLIQWFFTMDITILKKVLSHFKNYLIFIGPPVMADVPKEYIGAVKALSILSHANDMRKDGLDISEFYVTEFTSQLNFKEEYRQWRKSWINGNVSEFAIFNFPFLFDPSSKKRIIHIDAMVKMSREYEEACVNQSLVIYAHKFLDYSTTMDSLETGMKNHSSPFLVLEIRRSQIVNDTFSQLSKKYLELKKPLKVRFSGEEGLDQGGVQKEFFQVIVSHILDPSYGMFDYDPETRLCWFKRASLESLKIFEYFGVIVGLALYNGVMIGIPFPSIFFIKLLSEKFDLVEFQKSFPTLGKGLQQLLDWNDGDVSDIFMRTFEITYDDFGNMEHIPLIDNGSEIMVTNENRKKYVQLYIEHFASISISKQFKSFQSGFYRVCGGKALGLLKPIELELLLCGMPTNELDFTQLEEGAEYDDGYSPNHQIVRWFWELVHDMNLNHKRFLLEFVTASDRIPLKGLNNLQFIIQRNGPDSDRLPTALTCFGRLLLPEYSSKEKMQQLLITAIENAKGFGLV